MSKIHSSVTTREICNIISDISLKLGSENGSNWFNSLQRLLKKPNPPTQVLRFLRTEDLYVPPHLFSAQHFFATTNTEARIHYVDPRFVEYFGGFKDSILGGRLRFDFHRLLRSKTCSSINKRFDEPGGELNVWQLGRILKEMSYENLKDYDPVSVTTHFICIMKDLKGVLRFVDLHFCNGDSSRGWSIKMLLNKDIIFLNGSNNVDIITLNTENDSGGVFDE